MGIRKGDYEKEMNEITETLILATNVIADHQGKLEALRHAFKSVDNLLAVELEGQAKINSNQFGTNDLILKAIDAIRDSVSLLDRRIDSLGEHTTRRLDRALERIGQLETQTVEQDAKRVLGWSDQIGHNND